jgi:two-component sensor histidine kinase/putative methionine-R-sulfoxide reductase with GAF domain
MILKPFLGEILVDMCFLSEPELEEALQRQRNIFEEKKLPERFSRDRLVSEARLANDRSPLLGEILIEMEFVTTDQLEDALKEQNTGWEEYKSLKNEKLGSVIEISSIVNSTLNLTEVLTHIMRHVNRVTESYASTLMLLDDRTGELVFSIPTGPKADNLLDIRIPPGKGIAGWVAQHGKPLLVPNVREDPRFYPEVDKMTRFETTSILCVPLKAKTKLIGVLEVINKLNGNSFNEEDSLLLCIYAYHAAMAIENARLHSELKDRLEESKRAEEKIKASLKEKEVLLSEIHHRVKNNMQVVSSLLRIQAANIKDKQYADMFKESHDRIKSMGLVHEKLYQSEDFANVDFKGYVKSIANSLFRSYGIDTNKIKAKIEIGDVSLGVDTAVPCGLLINELVSNSLKHAFPEERNGEIRIALRSINEDEFELIVSDDGIGIPQDLDIKNTESFGMELISILAEDQLDGQIELDRTAGTRYQIRLKRQKYRPRI